MKVKNHRRRQGALRFPVSFLIHRCRWGCNSSTSSRSSDVIRDSLLESLSHESSLQDTADLLAESDHQHHESNIDQLSRSDNNNETVDIRGNTDAELLLGAISGGDNDSDVENGSGGADNSRMNPTSNSSNQANSNPSPSPKDTHGNSSSRPRRRTLQEVFQIDIQQELQRQPLSEVRENRSHPLYNFNHNLPMRRRQENSLAVQINPLFNLNDRFGPVGRNNLCSPSSLIAHFMQSSQHSSEESDSSSLRLGDGDIDIFRSEGQSSDSLPRDLPDDQTSPANANINNRVSNNSSDNTDNSTRQTSLSSALAENYSASLENVRFDFPHRVIALPNSGWLNNRVPRATGLPRRARPRRQVSNDSGSSDNSIRLQRPNVASYEINPISVQNNDSNDNNSNHSNVGSRSSSQSSGSNRVPTQQNWYFYDSRLLPGNQQNRVTVESNFRGVNTQFDVPNILLPPAYEEIGPIQTGQIPNQEMGTPLEPPPPYSDRYSDGGRPLSTSYSNTSIEGEPPPAYEQSFHHQLGEFSNLPREGEPDDDIDIDSELSDSLSSSVHLDVEEDDIPGDGPCQAILDNFLLVAGSPRQNQTAGESRDLTTLSSSTNNRPVSPFSLRPRSPSSFRPMSTSPIDPLSNHNSTNNLLELNNEQSNSLDNIDQRNTDNDLEEDQTDEAVIREFFPPPITARSVFGGRPALRWSRNTTINRWMNITQPWQL